MHYRFLFPAVFSLLCCLPQAQAHTLPDGAVPLEKSEKCAACHPTIFQEWQESFHAKSSVQKDPAHKAVYQSFIKAMEKKGKQGNYHCANCHAPMSDNLADLMSGKAEPDSGNWTQTEGTGCTFCHRIDSVVEKKNFNQYQLNKDGAFHTGSPTNKNAPHATKQSSLFVDGQICMGCHSHKITGNGVEVCVMKEEGKSNCLSCHMPQAEGGPAIGSTAKTHRSHTMMGGHDLDMLKKAVTLEAEIKSDGKQKIIAIAVKNIIQHSFPSTSPMRIAFVKVIAKDKAGKTVWSNFKDSPMEDKNALFFKAFKAGDQAGVPSWDADAVAFDTRLKAGETRSMSYPLENEAISEVDVALIYMLFPSKAINGFGIPKDGVNEKPYVIFKKTLTLGGATTDCWKKHTGELTVNYYTQSKQKQCNH